MFVIDFERAYSWTTRHEPRYEEFYVDVIPGAVEATDGGYVVEVRTEVDFREGGSVGSTGWRAAYYVADGEVRRIEEDEDRPPRQTWPCVYAAEQGE
jgi:hypothetical protein